MEKRTIQFFSFFFSLETSLAKEIRLRFLLSPVSFQPDPQNPERIGSLVCEKTELKGPAGKQYAVSTGEMEEIPTNMVRSALLIYVQMSILFPKNAGGQNFE